MSQIILYLLIFAIVLSVAAMFWKPSFAIPLMISSFSAEQMLYRFIPFFYDNVEFYNYFIGVVGIAGVLVGAVRYGLPSWLVTQRTVVVFSILLILSWLSYLWTPAPKSAMGALTHFTLSGTLSILLPLFTIRSRSDFDIITWMTILFALFVSFYIIVDPIEGTASRVLLAEEGTVLSPALLVGTAVIFLAAYERQHSAYVRYAAIGEYIVLPVIVIFLVTLALLGTRGQLAVAFVLAIVVYMYVYAKYAKYIVIAGALSGLVFYTVSLLNPDVGEEMFSAEVLFEDDTRKERFSEEELERGYQERVDMVNSILVFDKPIFGHGIMSWGYYQTGKDTYLYPHNSVAQLYFEVGLMGLGAFLVLIYFAGRIGYRVLVSRRIDGEKKQLMVMLLCYLAFSFLISLKQETFMSCLGVYLAVSMIAISNEAIYNRVRKRKKIEAAGRGERKSGSRRKKRKVYVS